MKFKTIQVYLFICSIALIISLLITDITYAAPEATGVILSGSPLTQIELQPNMTPNSYNAVDGKYIIELTEAPLAVKYASLVKNSSSKTPKPSQSPGPSSSPSPRTTPVDDTALDRALSEQKNRILNQQKNFFSSLNSSIQTKNSNPQAFQTAVNAVVVQMSKSEALAASKISGVKMVEPVRLVKASLMDSVPLINASSAWNGEAGVPLTGEGMRIAIVDTGVDYTHADLGGCLGPTCKVVGGYDFVNKDSDPIDDQGHGTHVAATAAGKGKLKGVAPDASIYAYKVLNSRGGGSSSDIVAGIDRAIDPNNDGNPKDHVDVVSLSLGGDGDPDDEMSTAIDNAVEAGVVATIAAGNSGPTEGSIGSPGTARNAITVAATNKVDYLAYFSSRGPVTWTKKDGTMAYSVKPDVAAPGVNICAARYKDAFPSGLTNCANDSTHVGISGTSMATPHVAGAVALLRQLHPDWTPLEIKMAIRNSAVYSAEMGSVLDTGYGRIDIKKMIHEKRPPIAEIQPLTKISGTITIRGTATAPSFANYKLSYAYGKNSTAFVDFKTSGQAAINGVLGTLDTQTLNEGFYTVRLVVTDNDGNQSEDRALMLVNNIEITAVGNNYNYISNKTYPVYGKKPLPGKWRIEVLNPPSLTPSVPTVQPKPQVICSSESEVPLTQGELCRADFSSFRNDKLQLALEVFHDGAWRPDETFNVGLVTELMDNWPQQFVGFSRGHSRLFSETPDSKSVKLALPSFSYCNHDGSCGGIPTLRFYDKNGTFRELSSLSDDSRLPDDYLSATVFDTEKNKNVYASADTFGSKIRKVFDSDGQVLASWNIPITNIGFSSPFTAYNRDGKTLSLFGITMAYNGLERTAFVSGYTTRGQSLPNFPFSLPAFTGKEAFYFLHPAFMSEDKDQNIAIVGGSYVQSDGVMKDPRLYMYIYGPNNKLLRTTTLFDGTGQTVIFQGTTPIVGDFVNDGKIKMAMAYTVVDIGMFLADKYNPQAYKTYVKVIDSQGKVLVTKNYIGNIIGGLYAADLGYSKNTPSLLVVLGDSWAAPMSKIISLDGDDFKQDFEINSRDRINGVVLADANNDSKSDIIMLTRPVYGRGAPSGVKIYNGNGDLVKNIVVPTVAYMEDVYSLTAGDFNSDGLIDLTFQSDVWPLNVHYGFGNETNTRLFALNLENKYSAETVQWGTALKDNQNTACLKCRTFGNVPVPPDTSPAIKIETGTTTPSLRLDYDTNKKESALTADFVVTIRTDEDPFKLYPNGSVNFENENTQAIPNPHFYESYTVMPKSNVKIVEDPLSGPYYVLPPHAETKFDFSARANPQIMAPGTYTANIAWIQLYKTDDSLAELAVPPHKTNKATILGEKAPYITSVTNVDSTCKSVTVSGIRFAPSANTLTIRTISTGDTLKPLTYRNVPSGQGGTRIYFNPQLLGIKEGDYTVTVTNQALGNSGTSNAVYLQIRNTAKVPCPTPSSDHYSSTPSSSLSIPSNLLNWVTNETIQPATIPTILPTPTSSPTPRSTLSPQPSLSPTPIYTPPATTYTSSVSSPTPSPAYTSTTKISPSPTYSSPTPTYTSFPSSSPSPYASPSPSHASQSQPSRAGLMASVFYAVGDILDTVFGTK